MLLTKFLLTLLLLTLPFGELFRISIGNDIYFKPLDITACVITLWLILWFLYKRKNVLKSILPFVFFPIVGFFSLLFNSTWLATNELITSSLYLIRWVGYIGVLLAVLTVEAEFKKKLILLLLLDGIIILFFGFIQYFFYSDIRQLFYIGWDDHMYRLFSTFYDPNFAGAFLCLYLFFCLGLYMSATTNKNKILLGVLSAFTLLAILLTYSRSALIMLLVGGSALLILFQLKRLIFVLIGLLVLFTLIVSPLFYIENTNLFRSASTGARLETYNNAFKIYQDHPVLGVGFNAYRYAQIEYGFREENPKYPSNSDSGVDSSLLFVLATTGIIGFAAYLYMWKAIISSALAHYKNNDKWVAAVFLASILGLFVNSFLINSLFFPAILVWMWVLFGVMHNEE